MKKVMMLVAGGILGAALPLMAETETIDGYTWSYTLDGTNATITGVSPATGDIVIPASVGEANYPVTCIAGGDMLGAGAAFYRCSGAFCIWRLQRHHEHSDSKLRYQFRASCVLGMYGTHGCHHPRIDCWSILE